MKAETLTAYGRNSIFFCITVYSWRVWALRHWVNRSRNFEVTWWSGNVRHQLPSDVTPLLRRTETLTTPLRKSKFSQFSPIVTVLRKTTV